MAVIAKHDCSKLWKRQVMVHDILMACDMTEFGILCRYIDSNQDLYVKRLADAVAIQSVSGLPEKRDEVVKMVKSVAKVT